MAARELHLPIELRDEVKLDWQAGMAEYE